MVERFQMSKNIGFYDIIKGVFDNLDQAQAYHAANSKPTPPELKVNSFNHKFIVLRGYKYHYVEEGDPNGVPLIFLHGFPDLWYGWRYQIRALAKEGYRVIALDALGSGDSDHPRCPVENVEPYHSKNIADNMIDLLDQLNIPKAVFIGHDWGGILIWQIGQFHPDRCLSIVRYVDISAGVHPYSRTINSFSDQALNCADNHDFSCMPRHESAHSVGIPYSPPRTEKVDYEQLSKRFPQLQYFTVFQTEKPDHWFEGDPHKHALAIVNAVYAKKPGTNVEEAQYYIDQFTRTSYHGAFNYYRAIPANFKNNLPYVGKPFTVPALQVIVEQDVVVTAEYVAMCPIDQIQHLEQVRISEGGHNIHTENPEALNRVLIEHLNKTYKKNATYHQQGQGQKQEEEVLKKSLAEA
ncbi:Bifunctional epoxide hydrolase 2 [Mortierella claussenii]|nr:Bifunctional epoxide hydrolase 2 [Mortierella claussenii]